jgi:hypothetical protein
MTNLDDRAGLCSPVTLSNEKAPAPSGHVLARIHLARAAWGPLTADARPIADPASGRPGRPPTTSTPRPPSFVHPDLKWE